MRLSSLALAVPALLATSTASAGWEVVEPNLGTVVMGVDFLDTTNGYFAGGANGVGPVIWKTADAGDTIRVLNSDLITMMYLDLSMDPSGFGVGGGMGAFYAFSGATQTTDGGRTFNRAGGRWFFSVYQDVETIDADHAVLVGSWGNVRTYYDGLMVTRDQGRTWDSYDWGVDTYPRYASFVGPELGYVSGGEWPSDTARSLSGVGGFAVSQHLTLPMTPESASRTEGTGYRGVVARTTDEGRSYEVLLDVDDVYMNGIHFIDEDNGWVVGEGENVANIYHTNDGGLTWDVQWSGVATLMQVRMVDARTGWAVGGDLSTLRPKALLLKTTDGGVTWTPETLDADFILFNIDAVDTTHAWAVGYNLATGNCGVLRFTDGR